MNLSLLACLTLPLPLAAGPQEAAGPDRAQPPLAALAELEPAPLTFPAPAYRRDSRFLGEGFLLYREERAFPDDDEFGAEALELSRAEARARLQALFPRPVRLEYALTDQVSGSELLAGTELVQPGRPVAFTDFEERSCVIDMDVEIAQATAIADPIIVPLAAGTGLVLQLDPIGDGAYQVEWLARRLRTEANGVVELEARYGGVQRVDGLHGSAAGVSRLVPGTPWTAAFTGADGETYELHLAAEVTEAARTVPGLCYLPTLGPSTQGFRARYRGGLDDTLRLQDFDEREEVDPARREFDDDLLEDWLARELVRITQAGSDAEKARVSSLGLAASSNLEQDAEYVAADLLDAVREYDDCGMFALGGENADVLRWLVERLAVRRAGTHDVALRVRIVRTGDEPRLLATFRAPLVDGLPAAFATGRARNTLLEWDVEVASSARIPDPVIGYIDSGVSGDVQVLEDAGGRPYAVELELSIQRLLGVDRHTLLLDEAIEGGALPTIGSNKSSPLAAPTQAEERVAVEIPRVGQSSFAGTYALPGSGPLLLRRSARTLFGAGWQIEVELRVD